MSNTGLNALHLLFNLPNHTNKGGTIDTIIPILQIRKLRLGEVSFLAQSSIRNADSTQAGPLCCTAPQEINFPGLWMCS